jgi:RNA polymerase sigma-70 factor (ECF subfamily)
VSTPDEEAQHFERTMLPFLGDLRAFALALARNPHDADDLVQETYLRAQRAYGTFERGTNAKAWLFTILRRAHIDRHRRGRLRPAAMAEEDLEDAAPSPGPSEPAEAWREIPPGSVLEAIERVPDPFRLPVRLRDLDGLSYREIGEILGVPAGTVMSRLHRGREYVRRALVERMKGPARTSRPPSEDPIAP